jgi:GNAT superfamily N-acetyltransferase
MATVPIAGEMSPPFQVRRAGPADGPALARLRFAFRTERRPAEEAESGFLERCTRWMETRLAAGRGWRCWVAEGDGQLVGTLWLQLVEKLPNPGDEAETHGYVTSVYVVPSSRNGGVGTALLSACLRECDAGDIDSVFLWSTPDSRRLYQRHGFAERDDLLDRR